MAIPTYLKLLLLLVLAWVLALFPVKMATAQDAAPEKMMRVKIIKRNDGKVEMLDTLISAREHADMLGTLNGYKIDTAALRRLSQSGTFKVLDADTAFAVEGLRSRVFNIDGASRIRIERMKGMNIENLDIYRLDTTKTIKGKKPLIIKMDSATTIIGRGPEEDWLKFATVLVDGKVVGQRGTEGSRIDTVRARVFRRSPATHPEVFLHSSHDSLGVVRLRSFRLLFDSTRTKTIERILINRGARSINTDSLLNLRGNASFKVTIDEKTGQRKVVRIDADGVEHPVKGQYLDLNAAEGTMIVIMRTDVQPITAEDKKNTAKCRGAGRD